MFKKIIITAALLGATLFGADLHWAKDYQTGIAQAQKENKPVLFIISSHSCKYCLLLDRTTLHDDKIVKALNKDFIAIRSWTDQRDYVPQILAQNTPGLPGIWFLYPNGDPMYQPLLGYVQTPDFQQAIGIVKSEFDKNKKRAKK
jgi:uncharacterized protein YyaL (SSP411 family)